jgi:hypothetical protein
MTAEDIMGEGLTALDVSTDGDYFRIGFKDSKGHPGSLTLPSECLNAFLMTLPRMVNLALQARHQDPSLRLVYQLGKFRTERSSDPKTVILTLATPDGFEVSFGLREDHLKGIIDGFERYFAGAEIPKSH